MFYSTREKAEYVKDLKEQAKVTRKMQIEAKYNNEHDLIRLCDNTLQDIRESIRRYG